MSTYYYWGSAEDGRSDAKAHIQIEDGYEVLSDKIVEEFEKALEVGSEGEFKLFFRASGEVFAFRL